MKTKTVAAWRVYIRLFPLTPEGEAKYKRWVGFTEWVAALTPEEIVAFCQLIRLAEASK